MSITGIGSTFGAGRAVAGRHAPPARRPAAPARHRQEVGHLCRHRARSRPRGRPAQPALRARRLRRARSPMSTSASIWRRPRSAASPTSRRTVKSAAFQSRRRSRATARRIAQSTAYSEPRRDARPAQHPGRRPLHVLRARAADQPSVASLEHIMDGDGARAGFKQIVSERKQADLGADGLGRAGDLGADRDLGAGGGRSRRLAVRLQARRASTRRSTNATVTGPAGAPPAMSVDLTGAARMPARPSSSASTCPDGTSETITLTATTSATPGPNEFTIGADAGRDRRQSADRR